MNKQRDKGSENTVRWKKMKIYQNICYASETVLRGKFIHVIVDIKIEKTSVKKPVSVEGWLSSELDKMSEFRELSQEIERQLNRLYSKGSIFISPG